MADLNKLCTEWTPRLLSVLRVIAAFLYIQHGGQKILSFPSVL